MTDRHTHVSRQHHGTWSGPSAYSTDSNLRDWVAGISACCLLTKGAAAGAGFAGAAATGAALGCVALGAVALGAGAALGTVAGVVGALAWGAGVALAGC